MSFRPVFVIAPLAASIVSFAPAVAQDATSVRAPAGFAPVQAPCVKQPDNSCTPVSAANPLPVSSAGGGTTDTVVKSASVDRGASVGTTAVTLMPANAARRGFQIQNQSASASCYISGLAAATADWHSLLIAPGAYYETPPTHVGTGAISIVCTAAGTPVFAREF